MTVRLFLIRHGETDHNKRGLALGRADVPLNGHGQNQVRKLASATAREPLTTIYSSPLRRALDTATAIADVRGLPVQVQESLVEMDIGEAEGLPYEEVRKRYPRIMTAGGCEDILPNAERLLDVQRRAWGFVEMIQGNHFGEDVAVVSHNMVILSLLTKVLSIDLGQFRCLRQSTASLSVIEMTANRAVVVRLNDTCHLA